MSGAQEAVIPDKHLSMAEQQQKMMSNVLFWMRFPVTISSFFRINAYLRNQRLGDLIVMSTTLFLCALVYTLYEVHKRKFISTTFVGRFLVSCFLCISSFGLAMSGGGSGSFVPLVAMIIIINVMCLFTSLFEKPDRLLYWAALFCLAFITVSTARWFLMSPDVRPGFWIGITITPCMAFMAVSYILREVTRRYTDMYNASEHGRLISEQAYEALEESMHEVEKARDEAQRANRIKSQFLANMSHELRTPLNAMIGYAELIGEELEEIKDPLVEDTKKITSAGIHLLQLIDELLDLSKLESDRFELALDWCVLEDELAKLSSLVTPLASKNQNVWECFAEPEVTKRLYEFDALRLRQCLINLIGNAAKFTLRGRISLRVSLKGKGEDAWLQFAVEDTGPGMSKDQCRHVFEPFWQADASSTRRVGGVGLGLALTKRLIGRMGGTLEVESELGVGSTFTINLPAGNHTIPNKAIETSSPENNLQQVT